MTEESVRAANLAQLEADHRAAEGALADLRTLWAREDAAIDDARMGILAAHSRGARDRDAARVRLGGVSVYSDSATKEQPDVDGAAAH